MLTTTGLTMAFQGTSWVAATPVHTSNNCTSVMTDGAGGSTITVSYATTSQSRTLVDQFRTSPPSLEGAVRLPDLRKGVASAGIAAPGDVLSTSYLIELAKPTYLVSIESSLTSRTEAGQTDASVAGKLAAWAISQRP